MTAHRLLLSQYLDRCQQTSFGSQTICGRPIRCSKSVITVVTLQRSLILPPARCRAQTDYQQFWLQFEYAGHKGVGHTFQNNENFSKLRLFEKVMVCKVENSNKLKKKKKKDTLTEVLTTFISFQTRINMAPYGDLGQTTYILGQDSSQCHNSRLRNVIFLILNMVKPVC